METVMLRFEGSRKVFNGVVKDTFTTFQSGSRPMKIGLVAYQNSQGLEREAYINLDTGGEMQYGARGKLVKVTGLVIVPAEE